jgi:hypothetical protein
MAASNTPPNIKIKVVTIGSLSSGPARRRALLGTSHFTTASSASVSITNSTRAPNATSSPVGLAPVNVLHVGEGNVGILFTRILNVESVAYQKDQITVEILGYR